MQMAGGAVVKDMVWIPGGVFRMGSEDWYPEERPVHTVEVDGFWMDEHAVTVAEFRRFVKATGYVTLAERPLDPGHVSRRGPRPVGPRRSRLPALPRSGRPARRPQLVGFLRVRAGSARADPRPRLMAWIAIRSPRSLGRMPSPTPHGRSKDLPTEAEWEFAARGGRDQKTYAWGDEFAPKGRMMANTWQGEFPWQNLLLDRYEGTAPVKSFPPNGYGLYEVCGNVWEWTADYFTPRHPDEAQHSCCAPLNPRVTTPDGSYDTGNPGATVPRRVTKGGSHLCAPNYCHRYRPAARQGEAIDTSTGHVGYRCILRSNRLASRSNDHRAGQRNS